MLATVLPVAVFMLILYRLWSVYESLMIYLKNGEYEIANNSAEWRAKV